MRLVWFHVVGCATALVFSFGSADETDAAETSIALEAGQHTLFDPVPDRALRSFSPDRPARAISPITVDAGHFQIESDFFTDTFDRQGRVRTRTYQAADPVLKLGLTKDLDIEVGLSGYIDTRTTGPMPVAGHGFGDVTLTGKLNLLGNDSGKVAFAIAPYLIVPSGTRLISAGQVQGGLIAPLTLQLPQDFGVTLQTEVDAAANVNGPGTHAAFTNIFDLNHPIPGIEHLTGTVELYTSVSTERRGTDTYTFDLALAYLVDADTQLDVGSNLGLNRASPDCQIYGGVARRF